MIDIPRSQDSCLELVTRIIVPYDGSKPSENALCRALSLAENHSQSSEITVLNVVQKIALPAMIQAPRFRSKITGEEITAEILVKELGQQMKEAALKMLEEKKQEIIRAHPTGHIRTKTKVLIGQPTEEIVKYAKEASADMIIIGSVGRSGLSKLRTLGSVSRGVSERAPCPVMITR